MKKWKESLKAFYNKDYLKIKKDGGFFVIATGNFLPGYALRSYDILDSVLSFKRTDGKKRRTARGLFIEKENEKQFYKNLNKLGIVYIGPDCPLDNWKRIADFFSNETAPVLKKAHERENWFKNIKEGRL